MLPTEHESASVSGKYPAGYSPKFASLSVWLQSNGFPAHEQGCMNSWMVVWFCITPDVTAGCSLNQLKEQDLCPHTGSNRSEPWDRIHTDITCKSGFCSCFCDLTLTSLSSLLYFCCLCFHQYCYQCTKSVCVIQPKLRNSPQFAILIFRGFLQSVNWGLCNYI